MSRRSRLARHGSVRVRLLLMSLLPILLILPLALWLTVANWAQRLDEALIAKVNGELTIAHQHLSRLLDSRLAAVSALGQSAAFARGQSSGQGSALQALLAQERSAQDLDFLYFIAADDGQAAPAPGAPPIWPIIDAALTQGQAGASIDIFSEQELAAIDPDLAEHARLSLVETAAAVPTDRTIETRGMVVQVAAPAIGGVLVGGILLNRNLDFIDEINALVYPYASLTEGSIGTATLFLDDVRISTNVRLFSNERALGTRVSAAVRARVLGDGQTWLNRAFVVNDWYISAYEPIFDSFGQRVGMLYVGFLEAPFSQARSRTIWQIALGFALVLVVFVPLLLRWARAVFVPLERMDSTIGLVQAGDLGARTGRPFALDEIGRAAAHLDSLLDQLQERDSRLRGWAEELEARVADRTRDLEEANRQLGITTAQLVLSEKLAAIGEISAGVAHEINNPLAVIQGNLDVIYDALGTAAGPLRYEFRLIVEQIQTIHILVSKVLQFARPEEYADSSTFDPNKTILDTLPLVQHHLSQNAIAIETDLTAGGRVAISQTELQQVLVNMIVNAIQAMPDGGTLTLRTARAGDWLVISVQDTGIGMSEQVAARVFDPFFTNRPGVGTGLGLSISRKLITRAGGTVSVNSTPGRGTTFEIRLPIGQEN